MAHDLAALLGPHGVARVAELAGRVDRHTVGRWVADRRLLRPRQGVVVLPPAWEDWRTRALAAGLATDGTLSHVSALTVWRVLDDDNGPVHVSVPATRRASRSRGLVVHRVQDLVSDQLDRSLSPRSPARLQTAGARRSVRAAVAEQSNGSAAP
ncbi:hypothetical protein ACU610_00765 [Geodermatophilus sp. URMC 61]|uniref:hypothetical protein n=1 Tax=Geodermatophilus sp. URMC 61 TaxID=3423411 RepID=UPI00406D0A9B